jgi:hypothetical protein
MTALSQAMDETDADYVVSMRTIFWIQLGKDGFVDGY